MKLLIRSSIRALNYTVLKHTLEKFIGIVIRISYSSFRDTWVIRFYKTTTLPVLLCDSEIWTMTKKENCNVEVSEMPLRPSLGSIECSLCNGIIRYFH
jgi:hypothetical protein